MEDGTTMLFGLGEFTVLEVTRVDDDDVVRVDVGPAGGAVVAETAAGVSAGGLPSTLVPGADDGDPTPLAANGPVA